MSALLGSYARFDLAFEKGEGVRLFTADGQSYLDFAAGIGVSLLGHSDPTLVAVLKEQGSKLWHVSNMYKIPEQEALAQKLVDATFADKVFFTNSGTEAIEGTIKTARRFHYTGGAPERFEIITFSGAFHGRSLGGIAAGGNPAYLEGFGPAAEGFKQATPNDLASVTELIGENTAGILIEPVQGEGGLCTMSNEFLQNLRKICDDQGLLLMMDEVQCGMGRSGKLFAYEHAGIQPDILAIAKGIGGGFPLGAFLATEDVAACMVPGTHGSTYGGNPLGCAIGGAVMDRVTDPAFLEHVQDISQKFIWELRQLAQKFPSLIEDVRGKGLMLGIKLSADVTARDFVYSLRGKGLLTAPAGDNVVRFLPPLIISEQDVAEAVQMLTEQLESYSA